MKYLFVFLLLGLVSCGDASGDASKDVTKEKQADDTGDEKSIVVVNGKNVSTIKIGNLEIMTEDLGRMDWMEATKACADLGDGWRLPTKDELNILYENKDKIGGFAYTYYWSSSESNAYNAWYFSFNNGSAYTNDKNNTLYVRAVRAF